MINKTGFILVKPQLPENIGFSARCLKNFGFSSLDLVNPKETWPNKKAIATSVGAKDILTKTKVFPSVESAINKYDIVYASSARKRDINKKHLSFNEFIKSIKKNKNKKIGIIFGPEASGLSNEDLVLCNYIFKIPVNKKFESINLSHSLIIVCYEIFRNIKGNYFNKDKKLKDVINKKKLSNFMCFIESRLEKKGFFKPSEKRKTMLINLRNIFGRTELSNKELRILSSIFSKL
tara:strand:+ start:905 stop:1609 length:705 start_codon:yes stop_codon:yes gene_type:complete